MGDMFGQAASSSIGILATFGQARWQIGADKS